MTPGPPPAFTCPCCGAKSWHPKDGEQKWCGRCSWWTGDPELPDSLFREWSVLATGLGGCCRLGPDTIARIARAVS